MYDTPKWQETTDHIPGRLSFTSFATTPGVFYYIVLGNWDVQDVGRSFTFNAY